MSPPHHPIFDPERREPTNGAFAREELRLANRNAGTLLESLRHDVTPPSLHYLLIHFDVPYVPSAAGWTLAIGGLVERPLRLTLDELRRCPERTLRVTLECAGNGRATITPRWQSQPWHHEAVGTAEWAGTPLRLLLERAGTFDEEDRLVGEKIYYDRATLLRQLGVFHEPDCAMGRITTVLAHPLTMAQIVGRKIWRQD